MTRKILIISFIAVVSITAFAHETSLHGKGFTVSETESGYLNYFVDDDSGNEIPLLDSGLIVNSRIFIKDSDKRFYLRDASEYKLDLLDESLIIKWTTLTLEITEEYKRTDTGVEYSVTINNKTGKERNVGLYLIYDTYLGEKDNNHFFIDDYKPVNREKIYEDGDIPYSIRSKNSLGQGLEFRFRDENSDRPNMVILANWEKLAKSKKWPYIPKSGNLFSYGYYSINDSAIGIVYSTRTVLPGEDLKYSFIINFTDNYAEPEEEVLQPEEPAELPVEESAPEEVVLEEEPVVEEVVAEDETSTDESVVLTESDTDDTVSPIDPEKEELMRMLDYIQKRKKGEDVSEFDFDEKYIEKKLKERDE